METNSDMRRASYLDFAEGIVTAVLDELPAGDPARQEVAAKAATVLVADYLQGMPGSNFMAPPRTFSSLDDETCENLGSMIHHTFAEAHYWPPAHADDGLREDQVNNMLAGLRYTLRNMTIGL